MNVARIRTPRREVVTFCVDAHEQILGGAHERGGGAASGLV
jgi:hypothetical protein